MISKPSAINKSTESGAVEVENNKNDKDTILLQQQIKIARCLASNDVRVRVKQLKKLKNWLNIRSNSSFPFTDVDFLRVWKGLFYCMWMSDKPLVQENLADDLGTLLNCFSNAETSIQFFGAFLKAMSNEWFGIDQWRMDKFLMLIRRMLRQILRILMQTKWKKKYIIALNKQLKLKVFTNNEANGLTMHLIDIYLEELAKVADGNINEAAVTLFIKPFIRFLAKQDEYKMLSHIRRNIFYHLLWQSDIGREFSDKFDAWKEMGFPTADINDLEKVEDDAEEEGVEETKNEESSADDEQQGTDDPKEKPLDPRAGRVDVIIPELPVDVEPLIREFEKLQYDEITNTKSRKIIRDLLEKYKTFQSGEFPLGVKKVPRMESNPIKPIIQSKIEELDRFENQLYSTSRQLKKLNKKKRKRILQCIDLNNGTVNEDNFEEMLAKAIPCKKPKLSYENKLHNSRKVLDDTEISLKKRPAPIKEASQEKLNKKKKKLATMQNSENEVNIKKKKQKKSIDIAFRSNDGVVTGRTVNGFAETSFEETDATSEPRIEFKRKGIKQNVKKHKRESMQATPKLAQKSSTLTTRDEVQATTTFKTNKKFKNMQKSEENAISISNKSEWDKPLQDGEIEYFVPSRKNQVKRANKSMQENADNTQSPANLVLNPFAKNKSGKKLARNQLLGKSLKKAQSLKNLESLRTPGIHKKKRVKIVLQKNSAQKPSEYIKQVLRSPQVPFDAEKKPTKSLLKPNLMPSPINPFYKKKIGLKLKE